MTTNGELSTHDYLLDTGSGDDPDELIDEALEANGELVLDFYSAIGSRPYAIPNSYQNKRGVTVNRWLLVTITPKLMPGKTISMVPDVLDPSDYDRRIFTTDWVRSQMNDTRGVGLAKKMHYDTINKVGGIACE